MKTRDVMSEEAEIMCSTYKLSYHYQNVKQFINDYHSQFAPYTPEINIENYCAYVVHNLKCNKLCSCVMILATQMNYLYSMS